VRICDAQARGDESLSLAALCCACVAQAALDYDDGRLGQPLRQREIEENLWRAIRHGLGGRMIDFTRGEEVPTRAALERLLEWTSSAREALGLEVELPERNGAQRAYAALADGRPIAEVYRDAIAETGQTYAPAETAAVSAEAVSSKR
jgi:carboxylate-amine ligase